MDEGGAGIVVDPVHVALAVYADVMRVDADGDLRGKTAVAGGVKGNERAAGAARSVGGVRPGKGALRVRQQVGRGRGAALRQSGRGCQSKQRQRQRRRKSRTERQLTLAERTHTYPICAEKSKRLGHWVRQGVMPRLATAERSPVRGNGRPVRSGLVEPTAEL